MKTNPITISGVKSAFVVVNDEGVEVGTITQHCKECLWVVYKGIGKESVYVGKATTKEGTFSILEL